MTVTAEGVEDHLDLVRLKTEGCDEGQGFPFSEARPRDEMMREPRPAKGVA